MAFYLFFYATVKYREIEKNYTNKIKLKILLIFLYLPYEVLAMATESRLLKESRYKLVIFDVIDVLLFQSSFATTQSQPKFGIHITSIVLHTSVVVSHDFTTNFLPNNYL